MATTQLPTQRTHDDIVVSEYETEPGGWLMFAGIVLMVAGVMRFFDSIWAFTYKGSIPENLQNALFGHSLSTYGWVWLGVAVLLFLCGIGAMVRSQFSRWVGIGAGAVAAISAIWWMPYYPVWSLAYTAMGVAVVYALAVHGRRID